MIYQTNSGLGYRQLAFLLKVEEGYLCIDIQNMVDGESGYTIGELVKGLSEGDLGESLYTIENSPLYNRYLFKKLLDDKIN